MGSPDLMMVRRFYKRSAPLEPEIDDCFSFYKRSAPLEPVPRHEGAWNGQPSHIAEAKVRRVGLRPRAERVGVAIVLNECRHILVKPELAGRKALT